MAAILSIGNFVEFPVRLEINDAGKDAVFKFKLTGKRLSVTESHAHFSPEGEHSGQSKRDFLLDHITGWSGQTLVIDKDTNQPCAFSRENFDLILNLLGVIDIVFAGYAKAVVQAQAPEGKAKN